MLRRPLFRIILGLAFWFPGAGAASSPTPSPDLAAEVAPEPAPAPLFPVEEIEQEPEPAPLLLPLLLPHSNAPATGSPLLAPALLAPALPTPALSTPALPTPALLAPSAPAPRRPQARAAAVGVTGGRTLHGHTFVPSQYIRDPFTSTYFTTLTAVSAAYSQPQDGSMPADPFLSAGYTQAVSLQVSVFRVLALRAVARGGVRSGVTAPALRAGGTDFHYGGSLGITASFRIKDRVRIGLVGDVDYSSNYNLNVLNTLDKLLNPAPTSVAALTDRFASLKDGLMTQGQPLVSSLGLTLAAGLHRSAGVLAEVSYLEQIRSAQPGASTRALTAAVALSLDLHGVSRIPVGALVGYRVVTALLPGPELPAQQGAIGLFYTGRPHLALGLDCLLTAPLSSGQATSVAFDGALVMRHYW